MLKSVFILFLLFSWLPNQAQESYRYTTKEGLPTNHVYDIAQDSNGFMWFATKLGVVKFDGDSFKTFTIQDGLPNNDTWRLVADKDGKVWCFSKNKYQGYIKNDSIFKFSNSLSSIITPRNFFKKNDSLILHTDLGLFMLKDSVFDNVKTVDEYSNSIKQIESKNTRDSKGFYFLPLDTINISFYDKKLTVLNKLTNHKKVFQLPFNTHINYGYTLLKEDVFFTSFKEGFVIVNLHNGDYKTFFYDALINQKKVEQIRVNLLTDHFQLSGPGYLLVYDYDYNLKKKFLFDNKELSVWSYLDNHGNIWQNSLKNGLTLVPSTQLDNKYYLKNEKVQKIGLFDNKIIAGIQNKGFYKLDTQNNSFEKIKELPSYGNIYHIKNKTENDKEYLISHNDSYVLSKGVKKHIIFKLFIEDDSIDHYFKDVIDFDNYYYFVNSNYVGRYNKLSHNHFKIPVTGFTYLKAFKNNIYVAGSDGLYSFKNNTISKPKSYNKLMDVSVNCLTTDKHHLFVGTDGRGVYTYNEQKVSHLLETDGLSIQRILKESDTLWLATQNGIKKILLNNKNLSQSQIIDAFYESDGLLQNNVNDIYKSKEWLYVASDIGLVKLNLQNKIYRQSPNLYFKSLNDTLTFKNGDRANVIINFNAQEYVNQEHINYQYRLLPNQTKWINTTAKTINFNNLSPKLHTLEVKAIDQHKNKTIVKQYLNIIPAWWETLIAKIAFTSILLILLYLFFILVQKRITKKEQAKVAQEKRVAGLELQALRSQMNPHFVHNSLNAIQYFIQRNEVELSENYLSKFSQLIRLFFEYSRRQNVTITEELELLNYYLDIEKLRFEEKLDYKISICEKINTDEQLIPSMILQPIVENAVNHGVFHKKSPGMIEVSFEKLNENTYKVKVEDDGIGINKSKILFRSSSKNYQSNSSKVLNERLELLNKGNDWDIEYVIKDLSETNLNKTGTIVILTFKQIYD